MVPFLLPYLPVPTFIFSFALAGCYCTCNNIIFRQKQSAKIPKQLLHIERAEHLFTLTRDEAGTDLTISFEDQMLQYVRSYSSQSDLDDTKPEVNPTKITS
jgi:hypothetical protein